MAVIRMLFFFGTTFFMLVKVDTAPMKYDQRQEGNFNLHCQLKNLLFVVALPNNSNLGDLALQALEFKKQLVSLRRSSSLKEQELIRSDEDSRHHEEPYSVDIIQINENHSNKGSTVQKTEGENKEMANISNQQTIFSINTEQNNSDRKAKNVEAFEFPKSREEPAIIGYFVDIRKMFGSKVMDDERARNVVEDIWNPNVESERPETTLKKQLFEKEKDVALLPLNTDKNDVASLPKNKHQDELWLIGHGIENCGPERHRNPVTAICEDDETKADKADKA